MVKTKKKVILLIVEGDCDEILLNYRLRSLFKDNNVLFRVENGDIMYNINKKVDSIKSKIGDTVKEFLAKNKFKSDNILCVLHIIDTDGCFIHENEVLIDSSQEKLTIYSEQNISVINERQKNNIVERNKIRSKRVNEMRSTQTILPSKIDYRMYFFSRNLEHVIFNNPNPSKDTKVTDVEKFIEELEIPIEEFLKGFMNFDYYDESWREITQNIASLQQSTNVPLLFEFIQNKISTNVQ